MSTSLFNVGFPKELTDRTFIQDDNHGQSELVTSRNDPYINPHNRLQLQDWRANVDLKPVLTIRGLQRAGLEPEIRTRPGPESGSGLANFILKHPGPGPGRHLFFMIFSGPGPRSKCKPGFL